MNENKVANVGPRVPGDVAKSLAEEAEARRQAILATQPKVEVPQPEPQVAAAVAELANEVVEKPKAAVFDNYSVAARTERAKKNRGALLKAVLVAIALGLAGLLIFLIMKTINSSNMAGVRSQTTTLYAATARIGDGNGENACTMLAKVYSDTSMGEDSFSAWVENCRGDMTEVAKAIRELDGNGAIGKDNILSARWSSVKATYGSLRPQLEKAVDFYTAAREYLVAYSDLDFYANTEETVTKLEAAASSLTDSSDEEIAEFGNDLVAKLKARASVYESQSSELKNAEDEYNKAITTLAQGGYGLLEDLTELKATLYDQANALRVSANTK